MKEPAYRSQICQHACATQLNHVMIAYAVPGGVIKRIVIVIFSDVQLQCLLKYQSIMQSKYLRELYSGDKKINLELPAIGNDYDVVYGYAQEHHTVELYMHLWKRHNDDVIANGTPPTIKKLYNLLVQHGTSVWVMLIPSEKHLFMTK